MSDFQRVLTKDKITITLDCDFFVCKSCHAYLLWESNKMTNTMIRPKNITKHCNTVIKR